MVADLNLDTYSSQQVIKHYADTAAELHAPEAVILERLRTTLQRTRMLDLGVGGGRTTAHFARMAAAYVGVDYVDGLVEVCRRKFPSLAFHTVDVRDLSRFPDASFGFILFSFNGIDYLASVHDRERALREIARVLEPGGHFAFSTHNLNSVRTWGRLEWSLNPARAAFRSFVSLQRRWRNNLAGVEDVEHAVLNDGAHGWRLRTMFVRPRAEIGRLQAAGLEVQEVFDLAGRPVAGAGLERQADAWLHYLCLRTPRPGDFISSNGSQIQRPRGFAR